MLVAQVAKSAGVEHRGIHHMRQSFGTTLAARGVHERVAPLLLGHSDSRTTREMYMHVSDPMIDGAIDAITGVVEEVTGAATDSSGSRIGSNGTDTPSETAGGDDGARR